jgi:hypothetical protein
MHPDVVSDQPDRCPKCGMKLLGAPAENLVWKDTVLCQDGRDR